jgi:hypothetical protein
MNEDNRKLIESCRASLASLFARIDAPTSESWTRMVGISEPFSYTLDPVRRVVCVTFAKKLTAHEIMEYAANLRGDRAFDPDYAEIVDLRQVEEVELDANQALSLADEVDPFSPASKRAFVATTPSQVNAARVHQLLRPGNDNIRIFETMAEAKRWTM